MKHQQTHQLLTPFHLLSALLVMGLVVAGLLYYLHLQRSIAQLEAQARTEIEATGLFGRTGRFFPARPPVEESALSPEQREDLERLRAIGYLSGTTEAAGRELGLTFHDPDGAWPGLNLYCSGHAPEALLLDMDGNLVHRWHQDITELWSPEDEMIKADAWWRRVYVWDNGDLLGLYANDGLVKLNKDSEVLWKYRAGVHHALEIQPDDSILVLTWEAQPVAYLHDSRIFREEFVTYLTAEGIPQRHISLFDALHETEFEYLLHGADEEGDLLHTNSLETLDGSLHDRHPAFARGNILLSFRNANALGILDPETGKIVWALQGDFRGQHDARILDSGSLLLFDNEGPGQQRSRILEFDPITQKLLWHYEGTPLQPFYSATCGTAQRLPNGNTFITESDYGRVFEVTPDGEIVWEFHNPERAGDRDQFVATLFDMMRLPPDYGAGWLERISQAP